MVTAVSNDTAWRNKVLLVSTIALVSVAYWQRWNVPTVRQPGPSSNRKEKNEASSTNDPTPSPKPVSASSVHMSCRVTPDITDEHGRLYAGEMLKIIDVAAGVAARRHTDLNCVTISLDRVILVREIRSGDVVHVDACINRAWGSSLEAGVRVLLEDEDTGELVYCCHAYLTFVALAPAPASHSGPPPSLRLGNTAPKSNQPRKKPIVAPIVPHTLIEKKRYLFAGRRRVMRTSRPAEDLTVLRTAVASMVPAHAKRQWASESGSSVSSSAAGSGRTSPRTDQDKRQARELRSLELELLADALEARDPHVHVDEGDVVRADAGVYGPDAPVVPLADLEIILEKRKKGRRPTWVDLRPDAMPVPPQAAWAIHNAPSFSPDSGTIPRPLLSPTVATISLSDPSRPRKLARATSDLQPITGPDESESGSGPSGFDIPRMVHMQDTLACTIQIVMPQHANSVGVLFGGQLMEWMERTAVLAAHRLKRDCAWVTAGMDGLLFREAVATGEVLTFRAVVTRVWTSSVEVYVCSHADVRRPYPPPPGGIQPCPGPSSRFTNEAFLTLVALTPTPARGSFGVHASPAHWMHERHLPPLQEETSPLAEDRHLHRRKSTMLPPTSANPVRIGAAIVEPSRASLRDIIRGAEKRRAERLDMREMLLR